MSLIAEFRVRSSPLVLGETLDAVPDMSLEIVQLTGTEQARPSLFLWATEGDFEAFETAMQDDESVCDIEKTSQFADKRLYRMRVSETADLVGYPVWTDVGADKLGARFADGWWHTRMRFPDRDAFSTVRERYASADVGFDLERLYRDSSPRRVELTEPQREVLRVAYDLGYFEVPRSVSMDEIAERLDISGQAVSERLRRGHRTLVGRHVGGGNPT